MEISTVSVFENIQRRPEMYFTSIEQLFNQILVAVKRQENVGNSKIELDLLQGIIEIDHYKYPCGHQSGMGSAIDDLTTMYIGSNNSSSSKGHGCLFGIGVILNAISNEITLNSNDGQSQFELRFLQQRLISSESEMRSNNYKFSLKCRFAIGFKVFS